MKDAFKERERALEDEFFFRVDQQLLADLKAKEVSEAKRSELATATGFTNEELLSELIGLGVSAQAVVAVSLIPFILVAWADGQVDPKERAPILQAAKSEGIIEGSPAWELLLHWLDQRPAKQMASTWNHYIQAVTSQVSGKARDVMRHKVLGRAKAVANAAGGFLNRGSTSPEEQRVLDKLERVFEAASVTNP